MVKKERIYYFFQYDHPNKVYTQQVVVMVMMASPSSAGKIVFSQ